MSGRRIAFYTAAWLVCFLIPSFSVVLVNCFPNAVRLAAPIPDDVLSRISIGIGVPADIVLLISLIGCESLILLAPVSPPWKAIIALAWFPLVVAQLFAILLGLVLLGNPL
jgi:hypothetical protein